jgi:hypothetical protein
MKEMEVMAACLPGRELTMGLVESYYDVLSPFSLAVVHRARLRILADTQRKEFFPSAAEWKMACQVASQEEAREAGRADGGPAMRCLYRDESAPRGDDGERPQCPALIPWPPEVQGTAGHYCPKHRPVSREQTRAQLHEIDEVFAQWLADAPLDPFRREVVAERVSRMTAGDHPIRASLEALQRILARARTMPGDHPAQTAPEAEQARQAQLKAMAETERWPKAALIWAEHRIADLQGGQEPAAAEKAPGARDDGESAHTPTDR